MTTTITDLEQAIEAAKAGEDVMTLCPVHGDSTPSLHVSPGADQPVVLKCHAGCETSAILGSIGLTVADISGDDEWKEKREEEDRWTPAGQASHIYSYKDAEGNEVFQVLRIPLPDRKKTFRQRRRSGTRWEWNLNGVTRVLYRLPQVLECVSAGATVYLVEGEKDVHTLVDAGFCATTNSGGAGKWEPQYTKALAGANVTIISDADEVGRAHARAVKAMLVEAGCSVEVCEPAAGIKDITDHINAGRGMDELVVTSPAEQQTRNTNAVDINDVILRPSEDFKFVIPDVLAASERLLVTGLEGHGKSTLLRQIAVMVAAGIDPFSLKEIEPKKVLVLDFENYPGQVLESYQQMVGLARYHRGEDVLGRGQLMIFEEWDNDSMDMSSESGSSWLLERIHSYKPDLVVGGPVMNLVAKDLRDDEVVRKLKSTLKRAAAVCGTAFILEHHAPHKEPGAKERSVRPYGSSTFLKFPDFGYGMRPDGDKDGWYEWQRTRFPRVRSRKFPEWFRTGTPGSAEWPWMPASQVEYEQA